MASGKTTLQGTLAEILNYKAIDEQIWNDINDKLGEFTDMPNKYNLIGQHIIYAISSILRDDKLMIRNLITNCWIPFLGKKWIHMYLKIKRRKVIVNARPGHNQDPDEHLATICHRIDQEARYCENHSLPYIVFETEDEVVKFCFRLSRWTEGHNFNYRG